MSFLAVSCVLLAQPCFADRESFDNERLALEQRIVSIEERLSALSSEDNALEERVHSVPPDHELREQVMSAVRAVRARLRAGDARSARRACAIAAAALRLFEVRVRTRSAQHQELIARREHTAALARRDRAADALQHQRARLEELRGSARVIVPIETPPVGAGGGTSEVIEEP